MCFGPQRRALFRHLNFRKWPEHSVFCTFWLRNVLRATTACTFSTSQPLKVLTFSTSQPLKVLRSWNALYILTSKCASRHNGVHFFDIAASTRAPKLRRFVHFDFEICFARFRATAACNFASLIWPHGSALAALASLLVDPPEPQIIGKAQHFSTFLPFHAPASSVFWLFSFLIFFLLLFSSLTLPTSVFSSVHVVGSLTSKLPSSKVM